MQNVMCGRKLKQTEIQPEHMIPTVKHSDGSSKTWGCFALPWKEKVVRVDGTMNRAKNKEEDFVDCKRLKTEAEIYLPAGQQL